MGDDYLPGENREQYVTRRAKPSVRQVRRWVKTKARPGTREFERLKKFPQHPDHIEALKEEFKE